VGKAEPACTPPPPQDPIDDLFGDEPVGATGAHGSGDSREENPTEAQGPVDKTKSLRTSSVPNETIKSEYEQERRVGPFVEDSDSDGDELPPRLFRSFSGPTNSLPEGPGPYSLDGTSEIRMESEVKEEEEDISLPDTNIFAPNGPPLLRSEETSVPEAIEEDEFGDADFEDEYMDGEEAIERRWLEEQMAIELAENGSINEGDASAVDDIFKTTEAEQSCPLCGESLAGVSDQDALVHVNNCLDGNPSPIKKPTPKSTTVFNRSDNSVTIRRMPHQFRPAKPGQENPFSLGQNPTPATSAFSKLMSSHAEDNAWAVAAASENASRGKPAYQRTCPFYKIMPGFSICVDAFRYGAVEGCEAYFLSHFHSDHYVGLTGSWSHGPIYCSRVTANLVRQQLKVDPKWVIALEFEEKTDVPGTKGVSVTMIPANHCPGSSLFLFEKTVGVGKNPRVQRVLHCGDFRACKAHVEHPLLRPEVMDVVTGKNRQQKIDVCYLDTTYLNPKYAFPCQEDVIKACADMCVSLNKTKVDERDEWEQMKRERSGSGMVKFIQKDQETKQEDTGTEASGTISASEDKPRGPLLVVVGTYSIGKERICLSIAKALDCKIYAPANKQRICAALEDEELNSRLTTNPRAAQVHMTPLFEIRAETLDDYLKDFRDTFTRCVGFRPSGWNYRPPNSRFTESPAVNTVLYSPSWQSSYSIRDLVPQRGSTSRAACFGVPYSEHSSFRELTMFCCALRIEKIIPTVNVGSAKSREKMRGWIEKWVMEKKKNGLFKVEGRWGDDVLRKSISA